MIHLAYFSTSNSRFSFRFGSPSPVGAPPEHGSYRIVLASENQQPTPTATSHARHGIPRPAKTAAFLLPSQPDLPSPGPTLQQARWVSHPCARPFAHARARASRAVASKLPARTPHAVDNHDVSPSPFSSNDGASHGPSRRLHKWQRRRLNSRHLGPCVAFNWLVLRAVLKINLAFHVSLCLPPALSPLCSGSAHFRLAGHVQQSPAAPTILSVPGPAAIVSYFLEISSLPPSPRHF